MIENYQAQIIWLGRSPKNASIEEKLDALAQLGTPPRYIQADAGDLEALQNAYQEIKRTYKRIHGIIHSAIVLADKSIVNMDEKQFCDGLSPKVDVSVRLAQVFASEKLDFVLFFSSSQSFAKMPGQSNYAAGCTFKDAFASRLAQEWNCPVKVMNWSYWGSVGVVATSAYRERMTRAGIGSIEPQEGMETLNFLLKSSLNQLVLFKQLPKMETNHNSDNTGLEESITTYPDEIPACIEDLSQYFTESTQINPLI